MSSMKLIALVAALSLSACEANVAVNPSLPAQAEVAEAKPTASLQNTPSCPLLNTAFKPGQHVDSDRTLWRCSGNDCSALAFNEVSFYQHHVSGPWGSGSSVNARVDIADFDGNNTQNLGCYALGDGDPLTIAGGDLRLLNSQYACAQRIPTGEIYSISQNCNTLTINGINFEYISTSTGY